VTLSSENSCVVKAHRDATVVVLVSFDVDSFWLFSLLPWWQCYYFSSVLMSRDFFKSVALLLFLPFFERGAMKHVFA
jgi:hypothetical protein